MKDSLKQLLTLDDNETQSYARWCGLLTFPFYHCMWIAHVFHLHKEWDSVNYAAGLAALIVAVTGMMHWEEKSHPVKQ